MEVRAEIKMNTEGWYSTKRNGRKAKEAAKESQGYTRGFIEVLLEMC